MATVTAWFETRRSLAVSLVSAGMGLAPVTMSPLVAQLTGAYNWRAVLMVLSAIVVATTLPLSLLLRRPPALASHEATGQWPPAEGTAYTLCAMVCVVVRAIVVPLWMGYDGTNVESVRA